MPFTVFQDSATVSWSGGGRRLVDGIAPRSVKASQSCSSPPSAKSSRHGGFGSHSALIAYQARARARGRAEGDRHAAIGSPEQTRPRRAPPGDRVEDVADVAAGEGASARAGRWRGSDQRGGEPARLLDQLAIIAVEVSSHRHMPSTLREWRARAPVPTPISSVGPDGLSVR